MPDAEHLEERTADEKQLTLTPSESELGRAPPTLEYSGLNALQLVCKMGDEDMFKHILGRQTMIMWRWGPVTQYMLDLTGVDSSGVGVSDCMELVGSVDANESTKSFILNDVMNGLLFQLFDLKWSSYAGSLHRWLLVLDCLYVVPLVFLIFIIKQDPAFLLNASLAGHAWYHPIASSLPLMVTFTAAASLVPEALFVSLWWRVQPAWRRRLGVRVMSSELVRWMSLFNVQGKILSILMYQIAHYLLEMHLLSLHAHHASGTSGSHAAGELVTRVVEPPGGGLWADDQGLIWLLLGLSSYMQVRFLVGQWLMPHPKIGVFMLTVERVMSERPACGFYTTSTLQLHSSSTALCSLSTQLTTTVYSARY